MTLTPEQKQLLPYLKPQGPVRQGHMWGFYPTDPATNLPVVPPKYFWRVTENKDAGGMCRITLIRTEVTFKQSFWSGKLTPKTREVAVGHATFSRFVTRQGHWSLYQEATYVLSQLWASSQPSPIDPLLGDYPPKQV